MKKISFILFILLLSCQKQQIGKIELSFPPVEFPDDSSDCGNSSKSDGIYYHSHYSEMLSHNNKNGITLTSEKKTYRRDEKISLILQNSSNKDLDLNGISRSAHLECGYPVTINSEFKVKGGVEKLGTSYFVGIVTFLQFKQSPQVIIKPGRKIQFEISVNNIVGEIYFILNYYPSTEAKYSDNIYSNIITLTN